MGFFSRIFGSPKPTFNLLDTQSTLGSLVESSRFNPEWSHTYVVKRLPSPGSRNIAYENLGLVEFTPIGAGTANRDMWRTVQAFPLFVLQGVPVAGFGGLSTGQSVFQPLIDVSAASGDSLSPPIVAG